MCHDGQCLGDYVYNHSEGNIIKTEVNKAGERIERREEECTCMNRCETESQRFESQLRV